MTAYTVSSFLAFLICIFLVVLLFFQKDKRQVHKDFTLVTFSTGVWCLFPFLAYDVERYGFTFSRLIYLFAIFTPPLFLNFTMSAINERNVRANNFVLKLSVLASFILSFFFLSPLFIKDISRTSLYGYIVPGPVFYVFVVFFSLVCGYAFWRLFLRIRKPQTLQFKYIFAGFFLAFIGGFMHFMPVFGMKEPFPHDILIIGYILVVFYAIIRHHLMDIEIIIRKTVVFAGLFIVSYGVFVSSIYVGTIIFEKHTGNRWIAMIPSVFFIVLILRPLESFLRNITDRFLFQKKYDYKDLLKKFTGEILLVLNLGELLQLTVENLSNILKLKNARIHMLDDPTRFFMAGDSGDEKHSTASNVNISEDFLCYLSGVGYYIAGSAEKNKFSFDVESAMGELEAEVAILLKGPKDIIGVLTLGEKKSDERFTQEDIDILLPLAHTLSIAVTNAQLFDKLSTAQAQAAQREKMAVIGTLSAGINHEICNPLGIIRGQTELFLLNIKDGLYENKDPQEVIKAACTVMEKVIRETDRATSITKKLSSFAKPAKDLIEENVSVSDELKEVLSLIEHDLKLTDIEVKVNVDEDLPKISADRKQLQEVLFNIVRNAAQSIKGPGTITIGAFRDKDAVCLNVTDTGSGIKKEYLSKVFDPFFTTKDPGKGTGLGLFIVKQIVEKNSGTISVESCYGKGTTFTLRFKYSESVQI